MTEAETIRDFNALYAGGQADRLRNEGNTNAMPPWALTRWFGRQVSKCPLDLWTYQEIIWDCRPDVLIETGTGGGGSALFFAGLFDRLGKGRVATVDSIQYPALHRDHPRIKYFTGSSIHPDMIMQLWAEAAGSVMVVLDALHTYDHVKAELKAYAHLVTPGQYLVVEDTSWCRTGERWADEAVAEFLVEHPEFEADTSRERHMLTSNKGGWLRRKP